MTYATHRDITVEIVDNRDERSRAQQFWFMAIEIMFKNM